MTLVDEDTNSIPTEDSNAAIQGNVTVQVTPLVTKLITITRGSYFQINTTDIVWWANSQLMQMVQSDGQVDICYHITEFSPSHKANFWAIKILGHESYLPIKMINHQSYFSVKRYFKWDVYLRGHT